MKIFFIFFLTVFVSCNSTKKVEEAMSVAPEMQCPKNGTCTFSVIANKSLQILEDGIGMKYPKLKDNPHTSIIKFRYHRKAPEGMMDGNYTEEVYLEIENDISKLELKDQELQQVKLLYGRLCYCKGNVGYFKVTDGLLNFQRNKNGTATLSLIFNNHEVPQIIKEIKGSISFEQ